MEYVIFAAALAGVLAVLMLMGYLDHKREEKRFIRRLYEEYGVLPDREYKWEQFQNISHYFLKHKEGFCIDDITWSDLNMDEVFMQMNHTWSAAGEEYLYYLIRKPCTDREELQKREEIIEFFRNNQDERVAAQVIFSKLGRCGKFSIYDYLDYLDDLGKRSNLPHYLSLALAVWSVVVMFTSLPMGLVMLVCVLIYNNVTYFKSQKEIEPYIVSFGYVFRLLDAVDAFKDSPIPPLKKELEELKADRKSVV